MHMTLKTLQRPAVTLIGLHIETRPMSPDIPALWPKFVARIPEIEGQTEPGVSYGVMRDGGAVLHYTAAVAVDASTRVPKGMTRVVLPAGTYAAFSYPLSGLAKGFGEIFNMLLPTSGYVQIPGPLFERYDESFDPADPSSAVGICLPVRHHGAQVSA